MGNNFSVIAFICIVLLLRKYKVEAIPFQTSLTNLILNALYISSVNETLWDACGFLCLIPHL